VDAKRTGVDVQSNYGDEGIAATKNNHFEQKNYDLYKTNISKYGIIKE